MTRPLRGRALRDAIEAELAANRPDKKNRIQRLKARAVEAAWVDHPGRAPDGTLNVNGVRVSSMVSKTMPDGVTLLEVYVDDPANQDPHYRVINPPSLVRDAAGDIELAGGKRYREDPVAAVAALIARAGGGAPKASQRGRVRR